MIAKVGISAVVAALVGVGGMAFGAQIQGSTASTLQAAAPSVTVPGAPTAALPALPPALPTSNVHAPEGTISALGTAAATTPLPVATPTLPTLPKSPTLPKLPLGTGADLTDPSGLKTPETGGSVKLGADAKAKGKTVKAKADTASSPPASVEQGDESESSNDDGVSISLDGSIKISLGG